MNRVRIAARVQEFLDEKKIPPRVLPKGFLLPLIEAAGNVEDPDLQDSGPALLLQASRVMSTSTRASPRLCGA